MTTAGPKPEEQAEVDALAARRCASKVPGGWPRRPRPIARFFYCDPIVPERATIWATC